MEESKVGKAGSLASSFSGAFSIVGSYQVCHNLCMGLIVLLSIVGITVTGMPLLFLQKVARPIWIIAIILLGISIWLYITRKCISKNLILFNIGVIIAGTPFSALSDFTRIFWVTGGSTMLISILLYIKDKTNKKKEL